MATSLFIAFLLDDDEGEQVCWQVISADIAPSAAYYDVFLPVAATI
jgi:hypothetical protein